MAVPHVTSAQETTPAFIAADVPGIFLPSSFKLQAADANLVPDASILYRRAPATQAFKEDESEQNPIADLKGTFVGPGFNQIFRPYSSENPIQGIPKESDNILELNLTHEIWSFGGQDLNSIPNRGFGKQSDVHLSGVVYMQNVLDVTDSTGGRLLIDRTGKLMDKNGNYIAKTPAEDKPRNIHFETGMFLKVPPTLSNPKSSLARMASIPHGVTINLQSTEISHTAGGKPDIQAVDITPRDVKFDKPSPPLSSQDVDKHFEARLPQNLTPFKNSISKELLKDPNSLLVDHNMNKTFTETVKFTVSNALQAKQYNAIVEVVETLDKLAKNPPPSFTDRDLWALMGLLERSSNIGNIAFLDGASSEQTNASTLQVKATFYISTVSYTFQVPHWTPSTRNGKPDVLRITPEENPDGKPYVKGTVPTFAFSEKEAIKAQQVTATAVQIQYTQTVNLIFGGRIWPHVSVATLVPLEDVFVSSENLKK